MITDDDQVKPIKIHHDYEVRYLPADQRIVRAFTASFGKVSDHKHPKTGDYIGDSRDALGLEHGADGDMTLQELLLKKMHGEMPQLSGHGLAVLALQQAFFHFVSDRKTTSSQQDYVDFLSSADLDQVQISHLLLKGLQCVMSHSQQEQMLFAMLDKVTESRFMPITQALEILQRKMKEQSDE